MVSSPGSRELVTINGGTFGTSIQLADQLEPGRTVYDMDLRTGTQIANSSAFPDRGAVFTVAGPFDATYCFEGCTPIGTLPGRAVIQSEGNLSIDGGSSYAVADLLRAPMVAARGPCLKIPPGCRC